MSKQIAGGTGALIALLDQHIDLTCLGVIARGQPSLVVAQLISARTKPTTSGTARST